MFYAIFKFKTENFLNWKIKNKTFSFLTLGFQMLTNAFLKKKTFIQTLCI